MGFTLVKSKIKDFDQWKEHFIEGKDDRKAASATKMRIFTTPGNKNEVWILGEFSDPAKFKAFMESPELKEAMAESGAIGPPEIFPLVHEFDE
ncbi:hypothetical protein LCGC14_2027470 [marine sediment metagenome]|uniref:ABM domain-containing protein n=1 Tax=marine sediment metagenome TaxID=412755 RepID=A0A0F9FI72_9ZZZZ